ncbi:MAG: hypothetical protein ACYTBZ_29430 [Planctomycetota bacterium]|jgi:hypothetical protein
MKKMIFLLLACLLLTNIGWGQATGFQRRAWSYAVTLDATDADTISMPNLTYGNTGKATYTTIVWVDSLDGSSDSLLIQYRRAWINVGPVATDTLFLGAGWGKGLSKSGTAAGDTIIGAALWDYAAYAKDAGAACDWTDLDVYCGPSGTLDQFDNDFNWMHGRRYECILDFDGYNWRYVQLKFTKTGDDSTTGDADSIKVWIELDID